MINIYVRRGEAAEGENTALYRSVIEICKDEFVPIDKLKIKINRASCILQLCARPSTYYYYYFCSGRKSSERTRPLAIVIHSRQDNIQRFKIK